jgi:hypothetical protein
LTASWLFNVFLADRKGRFEIGLCGHSPPSTVTCQLHVTQGSRLLVTRGPLPPRRASSFTKSGRVLDIRLHG